MLKGTIFVFMASASVLSAASLTPQPIQVNRAPRIDGKLTEDCWKKAPVTTDFIVIKDRKMPKAQRKTEVQIVYTNTAVVFGFKCYLPNDRFPAAADINKRAFYNDCVEIMINPSASDDEYLHYTVNCFNRTMTETREQGGVVGNAHWRGEFKSAVYKGNNFWSTEIEIPYAAMLITEAAPKSWRIDLMRQSYNLPDRNQEASNLTGDSHIAPSFKHITPPKNLAPYAWGIDAVQTEDKMIDGKQYIFVKNMLENRTNTARNLSYDVRLTPQKGGMAVNVSSKLSVANGEKKQAVSGAIEIPANGNYNGRVIVRDLATNRVLSNRLFSCKAAFTPMKITFSDPHYRDCIFESMKLDKVRGSIAVGVSKNVKTIEVVIRKAGDSQAVFKKQYAVKPVIEFEVSNAVLPYGKLETVATALDANGKKIAETVKVLRKLEFKSYEMFRGKDGIWRRGGKRIFILGLWGRDERYIFPGFNMTLMKTDKPGVNELLHLFTGKNSRILRKEGMSAKTKAAWGKLVNDNKNRDNVMINYLMDEPTVGGFSSELLFELATYIRDLDPYRPLLVSTTAAGNNLYLACGEFNALHTYNMSTRENPLANFSRMGMHLDHWRKTFDSVPVHLRQDVLWLHQGFNYADCGVRESPIPTYESYRQQNICALTMGCCGILQYNRNEEQFPELYIGVKHLTQELEVIGNQAIIQDAPATKPVSSDPALRLLGKHNKENGHYWLLAANFSDHAQEYTINFAPFGSKAVQVFSTGTKAQFKDGKITERFTPWEVKVYTTNPDNFGLLTVKEIADLVEKEYAKRPKKGNLAYQRYENETVKVYASSNAFKHLYDEVTLWHLADGVTSGTVCVNGHSHGVVVTKDATPNKTPDWIEMVFSKPQSIGRVVVYPAENSLRDYQVQAEVNGKYVTVAEVKNAQGLAQEHKFSAVTTRKIRIFVTATNGPNTRLYEIEVYNK